jgi:hypothetical protein
MEFRMARMASGDWTAAAKTPPHADCRRRGEEAEPFSTCGTHEGVDGEHALKKLSPGEPSGARDARAGKICGGGAVGFAGVGVRSEPSCLEEPFQTPGRGDDDAGHLFVVRGREGVKAGRSGARDFVDPIEYQGVKVDVEVRCGGAEALGEGHGTALRAAHAPQPAQIRAGGRSASGLATRHGSLDL